MKIEIAEEEYGRIEEIPDGQEIETCFICNRKIDPDLGSNHGLNYCCIAHKELHAPEDLGGEAYPFRVLYRPEVGRYMVAARDIEPGEVIFAEEALAIGPSHDSQPCCLDCMKPATPGYVCPKCGLPVCEEMCALGEEHSKECPFLARQKDKVRIEDFSQSHKIYWCITTLRMLRWRE